MTMYQFYRDPDGTVNQFNIMKGNVCIPFDPANTDYQEYLKWLDEGNTPEPASDT
jgi:hypothetical protein